jgi:hypothetical protein
LLPQSEVLKPQRGRGLEQCGEGGEQYQHQVVPSVEDVNDTQVDP